jgi:hypothetical protein
MRNRTTTPATTSPLILLTLFLFAVSCICSHILIFYSKALYQKLRNSVNCSASNRGCKNRGDPQVRASHFIPYFQRKSAAIRNAPLKLSELLLVSRTSPQQRAVSYGMSKTFDRNCGAARFTRNVNNGVLLKTEFLFLKDIRLGRGNRRFRSACPRTSGAAPGPPR